MATVQHVVTGEGDPTMTPPSIGAHYIDELTGRSWISYRWDGELFWIEQLTAVVETSPPDHLYTYPTPGIWLDRQAQGVWLSVPFEDGYRYRKVVFEETI